MFRSPFRKVLVKGRGKVFFGVQDTTTLRVLAGSLGSDTPDAEASETDILQCLLEAEILAAVAHAAPELDFLHAATISRNGNGILLVGASGRGKSTLSEVAALRGFQVLGDDVACVDFAARTAYSYPRKPRLRSDTAALLRPFGWEDRAFVATGEQTPITAICVLEPRADAPALTPLQGMDAVWQMIAHLFPAGRPLAPIVARIAQQLPGLPCYRLSPAGLQETIAMLETMTQSKVASL
jgi:hypothetical protein